MNLDNFVRAFTRAWNVSIFIIFTLLFIIIMCAVIKTTAKIIRGEEEITEDLKEESEGE